MIKYDIIGDIHGHATKLKELLAKLGYKKTENTYKHPEGRKVIFLGDYIDRGKEEETVIQIVKNMVENKDALAIMGNHEFNAICYATEVQGKYIREHTSKNTSQHQAFLDEYPFGSEKHKEAIEWFKTLPIFLEIDNIKCIHATWDEESITHLRKFLNKDNSLKENVVKYFVEGSEFYELIETVLKGVEYTLPEGMNWTDKDGFTRETMRFNWFKDRKLSEKITYKNSALSMPDHVDLPDVEIENAMPAYNGEYLVFFGHYWLNGKPSKQTNKIACLDYSVAKDGLLVCYRWNGEKEIINQNFIY